MKNLIFVYGTLKRGYGNNALLSDADFRGPAHTLSHYVLLQTGFPVMMDLQGDDAAQVAGELYQCNEKIISRLDMLESEGSMYFRLPVKVVVNETLWVAEAYFGNPARWGNRALPFCGRNIRGMYEWQPIVYA